MQTKIDIRPDKVRKVAHPLTRVEQEEKLLAPARRQEIEEWLRENRASFFKVNWRTLEVWFIDQDMAAIFKMMYG